MASSLKRGGDGWETARTARQEMTKVQVPMTKADETTAKAAKCAKREVVIARPPKAGAAIFLVSFTIRNSAFDIP